MSEEKKTVTKKETPVQNSVKTPTKEVNETESAEQKTAPTKEEVPSQKQSFKLEKGHYVAIAVIAILAVGIYFALPQTPEQTTQQTVPDVNLDATVATVNGQRITRADINQLQEIISIQLGGQQVPESVVLDNAIASALLEQEVARRGIIVSDEEAEMRLEEAVTQQDYTLEEVQAQLVQTGENYADLLEGYKTQMATEQLIDQILEERESELGVSDLEVQAFYEGNLEALSAQNPDQDVPSLEEMEGDIRGFLEGQQRQTLLQTYITELRDAADIKILGTPQAGYSNVQAVSAPAA